MKDSLDLDVAVAHLRAADSRMAGLIDRVGPCGLSVRPAATTFAALFRAIIYQQLSGRAAATIHSRVRDLFPRRHPSARRLLQLSDDALRGAGVSRPKLAALRDLAARATSRQLPTPEAMRAMDDERIIEQLTRVRGIGRWTVEMLLIFNLGRPDILPMDDLGIRKGLCWLYPKLADDLTRVERVSRPWQPWRSVASWYLWRAADFPAD
ncbi:MAG: DNA-3-methyladenine glycosylase 2 family protein [Gammaproteobacteria bacterium]|jgi:3-methyladenine DNA glycosylase/8-oxoguanine DNA glycosylase